MMYSVDDIINNYQELKDTIYPELDVFLSRTHDLELTITGMCNLRCSYCYFNRWWKENKTDIYKKKFVESDIIDITFSEFKKLTEFRESKNLFAGNPTLNLYGGDPMAALIVNPELFKSIIESYKKHKLVQDTGLSMPINGMYPGWENNEEFKDLILNCGIPFHFSFSLDGPVEFQKKQRCSSTWWNNEYPDYALNYTTDEEHEKYVFKFIDFINTIPNTTFGFHPMLSPHAYKNPKKFFDFYRKIQERYSIGHIGLMSIRNKNLNNDVTYEDASKFADEAFKFYKETGCGTWLNSVNALGTLGSVFNKRSYACSILSTLFVDVDGELSMCHRFKLTNDPDKYKLGFINKTDGKLYLDLDRICKLTRYSKQDKNDCNRCLFSPLCAGDCLAETAYNSSNLSANDKSVCHINRIEMFLKFRMDRMIVEYERNK